MCTRQLQMQNGNKFIYTVHKKNWNGIKTREISYKRASELYSDKIKSRLYLSLVLRKYFAPVQINACLCFPIILWSWVVRPKSKNELNWGKSIRCHVLLLTRLLQSDLTSDHQRNFSACILFSRFTVNASETHLKRNLFERRTHTILHRNTKYAHKF
jgi:hypothetical protein